MSGIILAGGASRRMGRDKAFVEFRGRPLIAHVVERVRPLCSEVLIVANEAEAFAPLEARVVGDLFPGKGSLGGIYSGLYAASESLVLAVACDMPFLNQSLLRYLISLSPGYDAVVPRARALSSPAERAGQEGSADASRQRPGSNRPVAKESDLHPLHAVYSKACLAPIERQLDAGDLRLIGFYDTVQVRVVGTDEIERFDPIHVSVFNVNTPEDLAMARELSAADRDV